MNEQPVILYGISRVRYDSAHEHIDSVMVHKVDSQSICCDGCEWRRLDVVHRINEGVPFFTLPKRKGGGVRVGQTVKVWRKKFIRSIPNGSDSDNLAHLPPVLGYYGISKVRYDSTHIARVLVHKVECQLDPKMGDARIRRDGITICCDGCEWGCRDVVQRIHEGDSFVTLRKAAPDPTVRVLRKKKGGMGQQRSFIRSIPTNEADNLRRLPRF